MEALEHHLNDPSQRGTRLTTMIDNDAHIVWIGRRPGTIMILR